MDNIRDTIFISHATPEDNDFIIWLASRLQLLGYKVWIDKDALIAGEKFWEEIDQVIRNNTIKFLLVYSGNICVSNSPGKLKDGIYKEYSLAESIGKQNNIEDFILLLNIDNAPFNLFIGADRFNHVGFWDNWATGLSQLNKKLIKDKCPCSLESSKTDFTNWFQGEYITPNPIVKKKELYYSNIWPIPRLPDCFFIHEFHNEKQAEHIFENFKEFPIGKIANNLSTFEGDLLYLKLETLGIDITPVKVHRVNINEMLLGFDREIFPTCRDAQNHFKSFMKRVFHQMMKNRGMSWYEMANKRQAYYFTRGNLPEKKVRFEYPYRKADKSKLKNLIGVHLGTNCWHYAISAKVILSPIVGFSLKSHLTFSESGYGVWKNTDGEVLKNKIHSHRRKKGKTMFNEEWRDMLLAFLYALKDEDGSVKIKVSATDELNFKAIPEVYWSDFGYFDPKDKTRHGLLSIYENEDDDDDLIENDYD